MPYTSSWLLPTAVSPGLLTAQSSCSRLPIQSITRQPINAPIATKNPAANQQLTPVPDATHTSHLHCISSLFSCQQHQSQLRPLKVGAPLLGGEGDRVFLAPGLFIVTAVAAAAVGACC
jgi:hypothetical protein